MVGMVRVKAGAGLIVFIPRRIKAGVGASPYRLEGDDIVEVNSGERFVMRSIRNGDLLVVKQSQPSTAPKKKPQSKRSD